MIWLSTSWLELENLQDLSCRESSERLLEVCQLWSLSREETAQLISFLSFYGFSSLDYLLPHFQVMEKNTFSKVSLNLSSTTLFFLCGVLLSWRFFAIYLLKVSWRRCYGGGCSQRSGRQEQEFFSFLVRIGSVALPTGVWNSLTSYQQWIRFQEEKRYTACNHQPSTIWDDCCSERGFHSRWFSWMKKNMAASKRITRAS